MSRRCSCAYADTPMELALILAPLGAGLGALIDRLGLPARHGVYFAMLTLAFAQLLWTWSSSGAT